MNWREMLNFSTRAISMWNYGRPSRLAPKNTRQIGNDERKEGFSLSLISHIKRSGSVLRKIVRSFLSRASIAKNMPVIDSEPSYKLVLKFTKVIPEAYPPTKGSVKAAGYDLKSAVDCKVPARGKTIVDTGLKIELPTGCYGRIAPRSGLAAKNFIDVGAGVVDEDYRGVLKVVLFNHSDADFEVKSGDRIAQLICERIYYPELEEVKDLSETVRGEGGFGSTGTN